MKPISVGFGRPFEGYDRLQRTATRSECLFSGLEQRVVAVYQTHHLWSHKLDKTIPFASIAFHDTSKRMRGR